MACSSVTPPRITRADILAMRPSFRELAGIVINILRDYRKVSSGRPASVRTMVESRLGVISRVNGMRNN